MWRLNVKGEYKTKVFKVRKFFVNNLHDFTPGDILLIQTLKSDEPGTIKRLRGFFVFDKISNEGAERESIALYGREWKYCLIPSRVVEFGMSDKFNFSDILGIERARKYDGRAEAVRILSDDERSVTSRISTYLHA